MAGSMSRTGRPQRALNRSSVEQVDWLVRRATVSNVIINGFSFVDNDTGARPATAEALVDQDAGRALPGRLDVEPAGPDLDCVPFAREEDRSGDRPTRRRRPSACAIVAPSDGDVPGLPVRRLRHRRRSGADNHDRRHSATDQTSQPATSAAHIPSASQHEGHRRRTIPPSEHHSPAASTLRRHDPNVPLLGSPPHHPCREIRPIRRQSDTEQATSPE